MKDNTVNISIDIGSVIGSAIAFALSYNTWHSIGWGIVHGILGWAYNIYFAIVYTDTLKGYLDYLFSSI